MKVHLGSGGIAPHILDLSTIKYEASRTYRKKREYLKK
jgi:hypothetical protein